MQRIDQVFKLEYGTRKLGSNKGNLAAGGMPVIASGDDPDSFGINSWKDVDATQNFCLTVARTGSAGATYFRDYPCTPTDHCIVLTPINPLSRQEMLWYQEALRAIRPMWSYGRTVTPEKLGAVSLPDPASWVREAVVPDLSSLKTPKIIANDRPQIDTATWSSFKLLELFDIKAGGGLSSYDASTSPGKVPFVAASKNNNAVVSMTGAKKATFPGGQLTLAKDGQGAIGLCFYQPKPFIASGHVLVLTPKGFVLDDLAGVFFSSVISQVRPLFSFGRAMSMDRIDRLTIRLPSTDDGKPCFKSISDFMSRLQFSDFASNTDEFKFAS